MQAVCVSADVIGSRENGKEKELEGIVHLLNEKYGELCITRFTKRMGDEIFGVLANYPDAYRLLKDLIHLSNEKSVPFYVGIGIGTVKDQSNVSAHHVNGTAIWNATDAIKLLKANDLSVKYFKNEQATFKYFFNASNYHIPHMLVNYMTYFIVERMEKRTQKQAEVINIIEKFPSLTLEEVGQKVGYNQNAGSNISKILMRSEYHFVHGAELELISFLEQIQGERGVADG
ncbi:SatD family protein [Virgibacillus natechei]|uniref:SatD family protein n=1 Tax=Virgibacillus sp. CBA3643 TaxID=2942278 RepID=UPI0035A395FE